MATPCQRKPSSRVSTEFTEVSSPSSTSRSDAGARRRHWSTTFRFQLVVLCLLLALLVLTILYFVVPWKRVPSTKTAMNSNSAADSGKRFVKNDGACGQHQSALDQYRAYLTTISNAQVVHVAAKSKPRANSLMELCGHLVPHTTPLYDDTMQFDGRFQFNSSTDERFDVLLRDTKGYKWVTETDGDDGPVVDQYASRLVHAGCLLSSEMPPLSLLGEKATVKTARWVKKPRKTEVRKGKNKECERALEIKFAGEKYVVTEHQGLLDDEFSTLCLQDFQSDSDSDGDDGGLKKLLRVESVDLVIYLALRDEDSPNSLFQEDLELLSLRSMPSCPTLSTSIHIIQPGNNDTSDDEPSHVWQASDLDEKLEAFYKATDFPEADLSAYDCQCCDGKKTCLFVHGIGVHEDVGVIDTFEDYWGKQVTKETLPCCSVIKFTHFDTVGPKWYSREMSKKLCRAAIAVSKNETYLVSSNKTSTASNENKSSNSQAQHSHVLKDMVVVAHSTANLHLAAAALYGDCELDRKSSRWLAIQGPMDGTMTANRVIKECREPNTTWDDLTRQVLVEFELCPITGSTQSLAFRGTMAASSCLDELYAQAVDVFKARVHANMCGVSPVGILSSSSPRFVALDKFSNHTSKLNDGAVEFGSCRGGFEESKFNSSYASHFYKAEINHDDGRMINGDGLWGETRKPLKWLQCQF